jgi:DnaJ-class molecular chaperone
LSKVKTHYDNLKVSRNAPQEVIRAAYKVLSQKHHPDRNQDDPNASHIMKIINHAYETLSDPIKRREHDLWIEKQENDSALEINKHHEQQPTQGMQEDLKKNSVMNGLRQIKNGLIGIRIVKTIKIKILPHLS